MSRNIPENISDSELDDQFGDELFEFGGDVELEQEDLLEELMDDEDYE